MPLNPNYPSIHTSW